MLNRPLGLFLAVRRRNASHCTTVPPNDVVIIITQSLLLMQGSLPGLVAILAALRLLQLNTNAILD